MRAFVEKHCGRLTVIGSQSFKLVAAGLLLAMYSSSSQALLILDVDIGGTNTYNNAVFDGEDSFFDASGFGGWSLTVAIAGAEPDYSGSSPEIHLTVAANCMLRDGCDELTVTAASDNPGPVINGLIDIAFAEGSSMTGLFTAFTGNAIDSWTESLASWTNDFEGFIGFSSAATGSLWGIQTVFNATSVGFASADTRMAVSEPGTLALLGVGLLGLGAITRRRRPRRKN